MNLDTIMTYFEEHHSIRKLCKILIFGAIAGISGALLANLGVLLPEYLVPYTAIITAALDAIHNWAKHNPKKKG